MNNGTATRGDFNSPRDILKVRAASDVEAWLVLDEPTSAFEPRDLENGTGVLALTDHPATSISVTVDLAQTDAQGRISELDLSYLGYLSTRVVADSTLLPERNVRIELLRRDSAYLADTVRGLYLLFQLIDSARLACDAALAEIDPDGRFTLGLPTVARMTKSNPLEIWAGLAAPVLFVVRFIVRQYNQVRLGHASAALVQAQANIASAQAEYISEQSRDLRLANDLKERFAESLDAADIKSLARRAVALSVAAVTPPLTEVADTAENETLDAVIEDELIPSATEALEDVEGISIEADDDWDVDSDDEPTTDQR